MQKSFQVLTDEKAIRQFITEAGFEWKLPTLQEGTQNRAEPKPFVFSTYGGFQHTALTRSFGTFVRWALVSAVAGNEDHARKAVAAVNTAMGADSVTDANAQIAKYGTSWAAALNVRSLEEKARAAGFDGNPRPAAEVIAELQAKQAHLYQARS